MNKEYYSAQELAGMPGMPLTAKGVHLRADNDNKSWQKRKKVKGKGFEYHVSSLPAETRNHLAKLAAEEAAREVSKKAHDAGLQVAKKLALKMKTNADISDLKRQQILAKAAHLTGTNRKRFESRIIMLELWQTYVRSSDKGITKATDEFLLMWRHNLINIHEDIRFIKDFIDDGLVYSTLNKWKNDPESLLPKYGHRKGKTIIDQQPELKEFMIAMIYTHPQAGAEDFMLAIETRFESVEKSKDGIRIPNKRTVERWLKRYKEENESVYVAMTNPDKWKNNFMPAMGTLEVDALNEKWEMDATPADWMFEDGRYSLLAKIDVYSRWPKFILSKTSTSGAQAKLLRDCFIEHGIPNIIKTDNGADYVSLQIKTALKSLGIEQQISAPFSPWEKPHIERFFRTLAHSILELLPGFIGHNVSERSAIEDRKQFSERLFKKDEVIEVKMTADQFEKHVNDWIQYIYMHDKHSGHEGKTPFQIVSEWQGPIRKVQDERALDILLSEVGERVVGKDGIRMDNFTYIAPELGPITGQRVQIRKDPVDVGTIFVFKDGEFICVAEDARFVGVRRQEIAYMAKQKAMSERKELKKQIRSAQTKQKVKDIAEEILAAKREQNNITMLPKRTEEYRNDMLDAASEAASMTEQTPYQAEPKASPIAVQNDSDPREVYRRWLRLDRRVQAGEQIDKRDFNWYCNYPEMPEFRDMKEFFEEFGLGLESSSN
ncbi:Mu transposase C-terminal domain-containing protein [Thiomicrorhabdus cannonii]|uniref:Mu transposase C-terminal domain-containing protein n=1 Tax=Thiomicrorhabdus cannonii TaxID=2748011 RepID=UPI0015B88A63|nr:Mu transposase C-terminal domain-containing protein [Thiomicrorhabdus cannonii]